MEELRPRSLAWDRRFAAYAWCVLAYNLLVILWGAVVRATGSGAGCGEHWPLCQGVVIPHGTQIATLIEFAHRTSSGISVILVVLLLVFAFRQFPFGHAARRWAAAALIFTLTEGLIGAALVLFGQVGTNASLTRAWILSLHLTNTFLLLASLALTAKSGGRPLSGATLPESQRRDHGASEPLVSLHSVLPPVNASSGPDLNALLWYGVGLLGALAMAVTGTIAALSDTLFHATSLTQGFQLDFSASANPLARLRIIHPIIAVAAGGYLILLGIRALGSPASPNARRLGRMLVALVAVQFLFGILNLVLLAPLGMQLLHLLTADLVWITLVLLSAEVLKSRWPTMSSEERVIRTPETQMVSQPDRAAIRSTLTPPKRA